MRRIIYQSIAAPDLDKAALFRLLYQARAANERTGMSGILFQADRRLLQVLEGPTWKLVALFETIRRDVRHSQVEVLDERSIDEATFGNWRMRYFDDRDIVKAINVITAEAGGAVPKPVEDAMLRFFGCDRAWANQLRLHLV